MPRKPLGPDTEDLRDERVADEQPSRSARKRESHELRRLGEQLVELRPERLATLALPERLSAAIGEARRLTSFGARRRQVQYIGKLMRELDADAVGAIRAALER